MQKKKASGPKCRKHRVNEEASSEPSKTSEGRKRRTGKKWRKTEQQDEKLQHRGMNLSEAEPTVFR